MKLKVTEALNKDVGRAYARMDPDDLKKLDINVGDTIMIYGKRQTICKAMPAYKEFRKQSRIQLDGISRENARCGIDETVSIQKISCQHAETIKLTAMDIIPKDRDLDYIGSLLDGLTVLEGDLIRAMLFGSRSADFWVESSVPKGPIIITPVTQLVIGKQQNKGFPKKTLSYEDVGGLKHQLQRIREIIELPLRYPEIFKQLGIDPPKGVLLHGPPGCGKTLIARAIANETEAHFFSINGPEIIHKFYGQSEAHLRKIFDEAAQKGPSIIFIDEIDAIAPKREKVLGDVEKRVVAQLLALMDGLNKRKHVMVIAATNIPDAIDPALRRPGRFDREISIPIPSQNDRENILEIHSRGMPLSDDLNLNYLAQITHGFVGADLEALCREAAMICLRKILPEINFSQNAIPYDKLKNLKVTMDDFISALKDVEPSAIREVFAEIPNVHWKDVGGLSRIKEKLQETVEWPILYAELFRQIKVRQPKGILLVGPPGCGKTLIAKAIATESHVNFISVKGPELFSKYIGESEKGVRDIFKKARQAAPCILFFDEIDGLLPDRRAETSDSMVASRVLSQFLAEFDGIEELKNVLVLGATNRKDLIDDAILRPGRFDEIIEVPLPDEQDRLEILNIYLKDRPKVAHLNVNDLAIKTKNFSGAELESICQKASLLAIRRVIIGKQTNMNLTPCITMEDIDNVLKAVIKSTNQ
ncbi:ATPase, AAA-type, CDC48 [Candidatus Magnetomorum sp. HK-1]|nr:ATPase, AAA-type, CDC48 [Candidatus Magnetomorum sp. HK-1]